MEDGLDTLGAEDVMAVGVEYGPLLQAAGGLASGAISIAEQKKAEDAAKANESKNVAAAIAADKAAATAMAAAEISAAGKTPSAAVDAQAAQMAITTQDRAAAALGADGHKKRVEAAEATLAAVVKVAQQKPTDKYQAALVRAWTAVVNKANAGAIMGPMMPGSGFDGYGGQSWFTRPVIGRIPGAGVLAIGAGVLGAGYLGVKKFFLK
jgi:hypothetical protein